MNRRYILPFLYMLALLTGLTICIGAEETIHIVQKGETIYSIARSYKVDLDTLMKFNGVEDPQKLQAGQRLAIPEKGSVIEYRVAKGDTLYSIARYHDITLQSLRNTNNLSESYILKEGDILKIPLKGAALAERNAPPQGTGSPNSASGSRSMPPPSNPAPAPGTGTGVRTPASKPADPSVRWPVAAKEVLYMTGKLYGVALLGEKSESVRSLTQGIVVSAGPYRGFGRVAIVQVTGGYLYVYGGCESLSVKEGDRVTPGTELGKLGVDTLSKKPQLFFLVYRSNTPIDPAKAPRA